MFLLVSNRWPWGQVKPFCVPASIFSLLGKDNHLEFFYWPNVQQFMLYGARCGQDSVICFQSSVRLPKISVGPVLAPNVVTDSIRSQPIWNFWNYTALNCFIIAFVPISKMAGIKPSLSWWPPFFPGCNLDPGVLYESFRNVVTQCSSKRWPYEKIIATLFPGVDILK